MTAVGGKLRLLAEGEQTPRVWRRALDPNESLSSNGLALGPFEQQMAVFHAPDLDSRDRGEDPLDERRLDLLDAMRIRSKAARSNDERYRHGVDCEDARPTPGDDVKQRVDGRRFDRFQHGAIDRTHGVGMTAREGDQVLVRLFGCSKPRPQASDCLLFERNDLAHGECL